MRPSAATEELTLRDGAVAELRPAGEGDEEALRHLLAGLSLESRARRFMTGAVNVARVARMTAASTDPRHHAIVAVTGDRVIGVGSYDVSGPDVAEVAFAVADEAHGRGVGTLLLRRVAEDAEAAGLDRLEAIVLPENHRMIEVFRESGFPVSVKPEGGVLHVEFPTTATDEARHRFEDRARRAAVAGVERILRPRSVALIGASDRPGTVAAAVTGNLLGAGFDGRVHLVNPARHRIAGHDAVPSVEQIDDDIDLAVVVVPAAAVVEVARACATRGVAALVVLSAGFAETGPDGAARQRELLAVCREAGMRLVGPNCMGVLSRGREGVLDATFAPEQPRPGAIALASQSGGLGLAAIHHALDVGCGLSSFVSFGNKADVSGNDLLQFWEQDPATSVILLYLESFGRPRSFSRIARRVTRTKPVVAVKAGRTPAGARAAGSHTGALVAASDVTVDALFRQAGVIRVDTADELLEVGAVLATLPLPRGPRVGIVSNAGGLGIMAADACGSEGLVVPELSQALRGRIAAARPQASTANPVDLLPDPSPDAFRSAVQELAGSGEVDAVVAIHVRPFAGSHPGVAETLVALAAERPGGLPVAPVVIGCARPEESLVPVLSSPERAVRALGRAWTHEARRLEPPGDVPAPTGFRADEAAALVAEAAAKGGGWLDPEACNALLDCYGIPRADARLVRSARAAAAAARDLRGPVVLKLVSRAVVHKTEANGVRTDLRTPAAVARAVREMRRDAEAQGREIDGFLVQEMVCGGVELLIGLVHDETFGPVVACGAGGTAAELIGDVAVRLAPLSDREAAGMVRSLKTFPLLNGFRGAPPVDVRGVEQIVLGLGLLAEAHPQVVEVDLNPVIATPERALAVDARVRVAAA